MKILSKKAVSAFVVTLILIGCSKNEQASSPTLAEVQQDFDRENTAAVAARPDLHPTQAIAQSGIQRAEKMLASASDANDKVFLAATQFIGYYNANTKSRSEICSNLGVDISPFVNAFKAAHINEYRIASEAYAKHNASLDEELVAEVHTRPGLKQAMEYMAGINNFTLKQLCVDFAQSADHYASGYASQKMQPETYAALHGR